MLVFLCKESVFSGQLSAQLINSFFGGGYRVGVSEHPLAVPEPAAMALVGLMLCGVFAGGLRRRWDSQARGV